MIDWMAFITVFVATLVSACLGVTLFSLALRFGAKESAVARALSKVFYGLLVLLVLFGIYIIVGDQLAHLAGWLG